MNEEHIYRLETIEEILTELCQMKYPGVTWAEIQTLSFLELSPFQNVYKNESWANDDIVHKAVKYRDEQSDEHMSMSVQEIERSYKETHEKYVAFMDLSNENSLTKHAFYNRSESNADFYHWTQLPVWLIEEAIALSFGKDPQRINEESLEVVPDTYSFRDLFEKRSQLVIRTVSVGDLKDPVRPIDFCSWAKSRNFDLPKALTNWTQTVRSKNKNPNDPLTDNQYWDRLRRLAEQAICNYPEWRDNSDQQGAKAATGPKKIEIERWLASDLNADTREANLLAKVLTDQFSELNRNQ